MSYPLKLLKTAWFGVKNNKVLLGFMLLLCAVIFPAFEVIFMHEPNASGVPECIAAYFCGIIAPIALFGYLHKGRECEFYNAMPVKKSQYFWGYVIAGFLIFLIPVTVMFLVESAFGFRDWNNFYLKSIGGFLSIYCSTILAVVFSGSTASTMVTVMIRNGVTIALVALPLMIAAVDVNAYVELLFRPICILTPLTVGNAILDPQTTGVQGYQLIVAAAELVIAFLLHRYRRNETVTALAFPKSRYFYQYIVMLIFALGADALLLLVSGAYDNVHGIIASGDSFAVVVFMTLLVIFITFILMNMVLEKDAKAAFKKIRHFFLFSACYVVLILLISGIGSYCIPHSVLPFRPDSAVIVTYSVEEVKANESFNFSPVEEVASDIHFDFAIHMIDEDDNYSIQYYKMIEQEKFTVESPDAVKRLVYFAMHPDRHLGETDYFGILPKDQKSPFETRSGIYYAYDTLIPESFTLFTVDFSATDHGGNTKFSTRYGFASSPQQVLSYKEN